MIVVVNLQTQQLWCHSQCQEMNHQLPVSYQFVRLIPHAPWMQPSKSVNQKSSDNPNYRKYYLVVLILHTLMAVIGSSMLDGLPSIHGYDIAPSMFQKTNWVKLSDTLCTYTVPLSNLL